MVSLVHAQAPQQPTTESQARYYVYGAFLTHAVPEIIGEGIALGPELAQRLGLKPGADRLQIYDALMTYTDGKRLIVRKASAEEMARYKPQSKRDLKDPVFTVQAGEITLLVEYDMQANAIPFVGQLGAAAQPQVVERRVAPPPTPPAAPVAIIAPPPQPKVVAPPPPPAPVTQPLKPNGPCLVQPVMSEQDLANCRGAPRTSTARAAPVAPVPVAPPPPVVKPQARVAPPPPPPVAPVRTGPCEVKPVMSEEDLANCRAVGEARTIQAGPPVVVKPQARVESDSRPQRAAPCVVKPVMSEEDLANCRNAPGGAARVQPGPPVVVKPQARVEPDAKPQRTAPCEIKAVMSEEDLANCRNAPGGAARVQPGPPLTAPRAAAPTPEPAARRPATPCVIKPVMSDEDRLACGMR